MADKRFVAKNGLDNNSQTIANVADPVNAQDAATKAFATNASNLATGTVLASLIADTAVTGKVLTGYTSGANTALAATDTILAAMGKIQGQINARLTGNQTITLSSEASGSGTTSIAVTLSNAAVIGKVLTGYAVGANTPITATDTILQAFQKLQGQVDVRLSGNQPITLSSEASGSGTTSIAVTLANSAVIGKVLTGYAVGANTALAAADTILGAFQKVQGQLDAKVPTSRTLTITNGTGITGGGAAVDLSADRSWTLGLTGQALAFHNLASAGIVTRTAADTIVARTITGTANQVTVTNGDGVAGNPTLSLPADVDIATTLDVGTVTGIAAATMRVGGDVRVGGTIYANDFVLTGGSGSGVGIVLDNLDDVIIGTASSGIALADGHVLVYDTTTGSTSKWRNKVLTTTLAVQNGGSAVGSRQTLNFIQGSNVTLTVADNAGSNRVDVTIASTAGGGTTTNALTFNTSGTGDASGTTFNGSVARTISYNTIGAIAKGGDTMTGALTISKAGSSLVSNDSVNGTDGAMVTYISFQRAGVEKAWVGYGDGGTLFRVRNNVGDLRLDASANLLFWAGDNQRGQFTSAGNFIVGTSLGADGLSLTAGAHNLSWGEGSGSSLANIFRQANSGALVLANGYKFTSTSNGFASSYGSSWAKSAIVLGLGSGDIRFYTDTATTVANGTDATPTLRMTIANNGTVEIPGSMSVAGNGSFNAQFNIGTTQATMNFYSSLGGTNAKNFRIRNDSGTLHFERINDGYTASSGIMQLDLANLTVGLGTTPSDGSKLDVDGKIRAGTTSSTGGSVVIQGQYSNGALSLWGTNYSSGGPMMMYGVKPSTTTTNAFVSSTGISASRGAYTIDGNIHRWFYAGASTVSIDASVTLTQAMILDASGGLVIGTDPGGSNLVRAASARITSLGVGMNASGTAGRIDANGDIVAFSTSDLRLKENLRPIVGALDALDQLSTVCYQWRQDLRDRHGYGTEVDMGLIAQEVERLFPHVVRMRADGYKAIRYERLMPVMIAAIKDLREEVRQLKEA